MASDRNLAVVLASHAHDMMTVDLQCHWRVPSSMAPAATAAPGPLRKSFLRKRDEPLCKTLERIRLLTAPTPVRGQRTSMEELTRSAPAVRLVRSDGSEIDDRMTNDAAWQQAAAIAIGPELLVPIRFNVPTVTSFAAPSSLYVDVPAVCHSVTVLFASSMDLVYEWCLVETTKAPVALAAAAPEASAGSKVSSLLSSTPEPTPDDVERARISGVVSRDACFVPRDEHVGSHFLVRIRPSDEGAMWTERVTNCTVQQAAVGFHPMPRWAHLRAMNALTETPSRFRVVTYNLLHDGFCTSVYAMTKRFPFATKETLDIDYRRARIVQELRRYDADIICCQEVGSDVFKRYYCSVLRSFGWASRLAIKGGGTQAEGCLTAFREARFEQRHYEELPLGWSTLRRVLPDIASNIDAQHPHLKEALENVTSVLALLLLRDRTTGRLVLFANTHLYYHGDACHIRALQFAMLGLEAERVRQQLGSPDTEVVVAGDFNFTRNTAGYRLATTGACEAGHRSWGKSLKYWWGVGGGDDDEEPASPAPVPTASRNKTSGASRGAAKKSSRSTSPSASSAAVSPAMTSPVPGESPVAASSLPPAASSPAAASASVAVGGAAPSTTTAFRRLGPPTVAFSADVAIPIALHDTHAEEPSLTFTNFALTFKEIIDHIFISRGLRRLAVLPAPSRDECGKDGAIPSPMYPSDHIALVADIDFVPGGGAMDERQNSIPVQED